MTNTRPFNDFWSSVVFVRNCIHDWFSHCKQGMRLLLAIRHCPSTSTLSRYNLCRALHTARQKENKQTLSFEELGVDHYVLKGVKRAFPHVETPTPLQLNFIPAILEGRDVLIKDNTGTGK